MDQLSNIKESDVLLRYLAHETDANENELVNQWLQQSPENVSYFNHLMHIWDDQENHMALDTKYETLEAWEKVNRTLNSTNHPSSRSQKYIWFTAAASILLVLCIGYIFFSNRSHSEMLTARTENSVQKITLPDKSAVWLNYKSELHYNKDFSKNRSLTLSGEAYFEVEHDPLHPFEIITSTARIKVLGTKFNVKAYPGNSQTEVTVTSGKVSFTPQTNQVKGKELILTNGEKGISQTDSIVPQKAVQENPNYMSWKTNEFVFNNTNIKDIVNTICNTYHVNMVIEAENTQNCNLSGTFTEQSLDEILDMLQVVFKVTYEKENNKIIVKSIGCQ